MKKGKSGADLQIRVRKTGGNIDRLLQQANYLKGIRSLGIDRVPQIYEIGPDYYDMEWAGVPPTSNLHSKYILQALQVLQEEFWPHAPIAVNPGWRDNLEREFGADIDMLRPNLDIIQERDLIHGDPTFANLVVGSVCQPVILDALPPAHVMPSHRVVDIGKLLQSACGYELLLKNRVWPETHHQLIHGILESTGFRREALFFGLVHIRRLSKYDPTDFTVLVERLLQHA